MTEQNRALRHLIVGIGDRERAKMPSGLVGVLTELLDKISCLEDHTPTTKMDQNNLFTRVSNLERKERFFENGLTTRVNALEKRNAELKENSSGAQDLTMIMNRLNSLEKRNNELADTVNFLQMKCAEQSSEIELLQKSKKSEYPQTYDIPPPSYYEVSEINKVDNHYHDPNDDDVLSLMSDMTDITNVSESTQETGTFIQPLYEARLGKAPQSCLGKMCTQCKHRIPRGFHLRGNYFCTAICANRYQKENSTEENSVPKEQPKSCLLNYCAQCKTHCPGKSKMYNIKGTYFCTSICAKEYQKQKSPTKGNFTSVMDPAIYN